MKFDPKLKLGVELEVEVMDNPEKFTHHTSTYTIYGSYPKHHPMGHEHTHHGNLVKVADRVAGGEIETHYDNTVNDGFEWVGKPMTLKENKETWGKLLSNDTLAQFIHGEDVQQTPGNGYGIHDVGMHIHVSGDPITPLVLGKLAVFINSRTNLPFIEYMAGRKLNKFCKTQASFKVEHAQYLYHSMDCKKTSKRGKRIESIGNGSWDVSVAGGYCCENAGKLMTLKLQRGAIWLAPALQTGDFEVRIFKSTVKPERFNANLEFIVALVEFCVETGIKNLSFKEFGDWMSSLSNRVKYTTLFKFMREEGYAEGIVPGNETLKKMILENKVDFSWAAAA